MTTTDAATRPAEHACGGPKFGRLTAGCPRCDELLAGEAPARGGWQKSITTQHTCGGPKFGHKTPGCPRCDELLDGAEPVVQEWRGQTARNEERSRRDSRAHFTSQRHLTGGCGPVCTFGEW